MSIGLLYPLNDDFGVRLSNPQSAQGQAETNTIARIPSEIVRAATKQNNL
jgi:hypothetical protein